jgi:hypothetical protein
MDIGATTKKIGKKNTVSAYYEKGKHESKGEI